MFSLSRQLFAILTVLAVFSTQTLAADDAAEHKAEIKKLKSLMHDAIDAQDLETAIKHQEAVVFNVHAANHKNPDEDLREDAILHSDLLTMLKASAKLSEGKRVKLFSVFEGIKSANEFDLKHKYLEQIETLLKAIDTYHKHLEAAEMKSLDYGLQIMLGYAYENIGELEKSVEAFSRVREIRIKHYGERHPDLLGECLNLSVCNLVQGDLASAELYCRDYLERNQGDAIDYGMSYAAGLSVLGMIHMSNNRSAEAEALSLAAIAYTARSTDKATFAAARSYLSLAEINMLRGKHDKSKQLYQKSLFIYKEVAGENSFHFAEATKKYAVLLKVMGDGEEAQRITNEANEMVKHYKDKLREMSREQ